jgi:hypothetical protein
MNARALFSMCAAIIIAFVSYGCASGPRVYAHSAADFSPSAYRTFGFLRAKKTDGEAYAYSTLLTQHLEAATTRELQSRGYQPSAEPDLLVNFHVVATDKVEVRQTPSAYYGWRRGYAWNGMGYGSEVRSFTQGTLYIDLVDLARNQLVWEGVAVGRVTEEKLKDPEPAITGAVAAIFARFPLR